ncbi:hypothetical protein [Serpentinimonas maccroryi]|uniref:hypothetical protein n=1 Tax=Serpentinimonas maccroryi TaxID=1458426 RepID=UPI002033CE04|nr:hypothetical protein [Serpentinimonas maccroryi]MCM2480184.1 hypothetical protein [Serpentinimonas maccroryi]
MNTDMNSADFDELAGRIDGVAQAVMLLGAALEMQRLMDGPYWCALLRQARPEALATTPLRQASRRLLQRMAHQLDDARRARQARPSPSDR